MMSQRIRIGGISLLNGMINLRSDTQTLPTEEMLEAMAKAPLGDDVYGEDPTVNALEELAASVVGKEAALFVPSGTMGNLIALKVHTRHGEEVILEKDSHIYYYEAGGLAAICGLTPRLVTGHMGVMDAEDIEEALRPYNIHHPPTSLICYENTHNRAGGTVVSVEKSKELYELAKKHGFAVHLDGARIFNAALYLGVDAKVLASYADSVMFCLSKGLSAPVGSVLTGSKDFIKRARHVRKMLGGGMRQAGVLAAAGIIAISKMRDRLEEDHKNAQLLAKGVAEIPGLTVDLKTVQTNMVNVNIDPSIMPLSTFVDELEKRRVLVSTRPPRGIRLVTHRHVSREDIETTLEVMKEILA